MSSGSVWNYFEKKAMYFEKAAEKFRELVRVCEELRSRNEPYNESNYMHAVEKLAFYPVLRKAVSNRQIDKKYVDRFRELLQDFVQNEIVYENDGVFCPEKIPQLIHDIVQEISTDKELQKIECPFANMSFGPLPDQPISIEETEYERIRKAYTEFFRARNATEMQLLIKKIEPNFQMFLKH